MLYVRTNFFIRGVRGCYAVNWCDGDTVKFWMLCVKILDVIRAYAENDKLLRH